MNQELNVGDLVETVIGNHLGTIIRVVKDRNKGKCDLVWVYLHSRETERPFHFSRLRKL
jgi:hypothetical protein